MTTMTIRRIQECPAQNHVVLEITGDVTHTVRGDMADLNAPLTDEEKTVFIRGIIKFAKITRTNNQIRTALTNGVTVTI